MLPPRLTARWAAAQIKDLVATKYPTTIALLPPAAWPVYLLNSWTKKKIILLASKPILSENFLGLAATGARCVLVKLARVNVAIGGHRFIHP